MEKTMITANAILTKVDALINELKGAQGHENWDKTLEIDRAFQNEHGIRRYIKSDWKNCRYAFNMDAVYDELSIFDWWGRKLSLNQLLDMRKFLREAIKLGYDGYVCFKVGATGCANGMWAHKELSTTGYSPDGPCIYKSFTPDYNYWSINPTGEEWLPARGEYNRIKTIKDFEKFIKENC